MAGDTLRNRIRYEVRNNAWARNLIETLVANIVGTGFTPHPLFGSDDEGKAAVDAKKWARAARTLFRRWANHADADGGNFDGLFSTAVRGMIEAGETFIVRTTGESAGVPLQVRVLEAEMVPLWKTEAVNGGAIRAGIEYDRSQRVVAYWMYPEHPGEFTLNPVTRNVELVRIPARNVIHLFRRLRPGQGRGEPWLASVLLRLHDLAGYADAEVVRKKGAANFIFKIEAPDPDNVSQAIGELHDKAAANGEVDTKPGSTVVTAVGEKMDVISPADVGPNFEPFFVMILREICAGPGVPYALATGDMSQETYTSHRAGLLEFWRRCDAIQFNTLVPKLRELWAWFLEDAILSSQITVARWAQWREFYLDCDWIPAGRDWIDPQKEVGAKGEELNLKITSRTRICAERGEDFADIIKELAEEDRQMKEAGIESAPVQRGQVAQPQQPDEERPPQRRTGTDG